MVDCGGFVRWRLVEKRKGVSRGGCRGNGLALCIVSSP
jgi:hypothetical protein